MLVVIVWSPATFAKRHSKHCTVRKNPPVALYNEPVTKSPFGSHDIGQSGRAGPCTSSKTPGMSA